MKVEIRIGDISSNKRIKYSFEKLDDIIDERKRMYNFLLNNKDCIIEDVDDYLLYTLNNGLMSFIVKDNPEITDEKFKDEDYDLIPKFDPKNYKVFEIKEDGNEYSLQDKDGNVGKNYFNKLMGCIMDDFYSCINFYEPK